MVVSGLARGIDTAAHEGALAADGATVAVIAAGVDVAYPPENAALMARIAAEGAVVSERPLGATARAKDFPRRNRVIAGLALGVVVVEAAPASGSLITARLAVEYGREVMAVPGGPQDPRHRGTNQLLRDGAHLVETAADVLAVLAPLLRHAEVPPARARDGCRRTLAPVPASPAPGRRRERPGGDALVERVARALGPTPLAVDELIRECDAAAPDVQAALLELELAGRIDRQPGNRVCLRARAEVDRGRRTVCGPAGRALPDRSRQRSCVAHGCRRRRVAHQGQDHQQVSGRRVQGPGQLRPCPRPAGSKDGSVLPDEDFKIIYEALQDRRSASTRSPRRSRAGPRA